MSEPLSDQEQLPISDQGSAVKAVQTGIILAPTQEENDNCSPLRSGERIGFQIPGWIWGVMLACYGVFFLAIFAGMGHSTHARFVIIVAILFAVMFFGVSRILAGLAGPQPRSPIARAGGILPTSSGPMSDKAVAAQILTVPFAIALMGTCILIIRLVVA